MSKNLTVAVSFSLALNSSEAWICATRLRNAGQDVHGSRDLSFPGSTVSTGTLLVPSKRCSDDGLVSENDGIARGGREKTLKKRDGRVEDRIAFPASFGADFDLHGVDNVGVKSGDVRRGRGVEIGRPEIRTELVDWTAPKGVRCVEEDE